MSGYCNRISIRYKSIRLSSITFTRNNRSKDCIRMAIRNHRTNWCQDKGNSWIKTMSIWGKSFYKISQNHHRHLKSNLRLQMSISKRNQLNLKTNKKLEHISHNKMKNFRRQLFYPRYNLKKASIKINRRKTQIKLILKITNSQDFNNNNNQHQKPKSSHNKTQI